MSFGILQGISTLMPCTGRVFLVFSGNIRKKVFIDVELE
jgi:hypothetical protein